MGPSPSSHSHPAPILLQELLLHPTTMNHLPTYSLSCLTVGLSLFPVFQLVFQQVISSGCELQVTPSTGCSNGSDKGGQGSFLSTHIHHTPCIPAGCSKWPLLPPLTKHSFTPDSTLSFRPREQDKINLRPPTKPGQRGVARGISNSFIWTQFQPLCLFGE